MPDRIIRFLPSFFDDLDSQLPVERSTAGEPSATDFLLYELPRLRDQLASDFVGNTLSLPGLAPLRMLIATGTLVRSVAIYAYVDANDDVAVVALDMALRTGDEAVSSSSGVAADLWRSGDRDAADGEVYAAGHGEVGNDFPLLAAVAKAKPVDGGYTLHGHKIFSSLTPVWTRLGVHALDESDPANPRIVHAFMARDTDGYSIKETWDVLGMGATRSDDTILDGVFVPSDHIARVVPAGLAGADNFVLGVFAWAEPTFSSIYYPIAQRALDLAAASVKKKTSVAMGGRSMAYNPMYQYVLAEMFLQVEAVGPHLERIASDWSNGVDHGGLWPAKLVSLKHHATESTKRVVDMAMELSGGGGMFKGQRAGAPISRRSMRRLPSRQRSSRPRTGRQDRSGSPRRRTSLGLATTANWCQRLISRSGTDD